MKLSDYVIDFLVQRGVTHVFGMSGGAAVHLFDSAARHPKMDYVCSQHEQSAALSADGYARVTGRMGVAITTSGPGATNLLTGTCCSYFDSVPTLMLTGQVATHRLKGDHAIRQMGFQETDVLSIFSSVTKHAAQVRDPRHIRRHLEEAWYWAFEGRPGSVLVDLPDDLQRAEIDPATLEPFVPPVPAAPTSPLDADLDRLMKLVEGAKRPVLVLGGGLSTPRLGPEFDALIHRLGMPVALTWAALDLMADDHPLRVGPFGVYGPRLGNFAIQNADLLVCLGTRLSQNVTGGLLATFAREADIVMVDAARGELDKFNGRGIDIGLRIEARLDNFVPKWLGRLANAPPQSFTDWQERIAHWRRILPHDRPEPPKSGTGHVDAYDFVERLSEVLPPNELIFVDTGGNLTWTCNGLRTKRGQRLMSAWNNTPMGYALPAAIGAAQAPREAGITCIIGDGGLMICLAELSTLVEQKIPIKVLVFNNHGHGIQKQTLETWLDARYVGVHGPSGLSFPPIGPVARAIGLKVVDIADSKDIAERLREVYATPGPVLANVEIDPAQKLYPVLKFGAPLEDQLPAMDPAVLAREMIISSLERWAPLPSATPGV
ncbi:MAG: thiamine pyrophosphate-binding protein [Proteobacteria bacterium]|nr:thiamine pyrophosphate-binding protein [Pseudomonadota bacterium]